MKMGNLGLLQPSCHQEEGQSQSEAQKAEEKAEMFGALEDTAEWLIVAEACLRS